MVLDKIKAANDEINQLKQATKKLKQKVQAN